MVRPTGVERHPDIQEMRATRERAGSMPIAQVTEGLSIVAGLYLAISPWIVGFSGLTRLTVNNLITGLALAVLAMGFASAYGRTYGLSWIAPVIGLWTIIAPFVMRSATTSTVWNNVVIGAIILLLGLGAMAFGMSRRQPHKFGGNGHRH
ncbi:SPW repeat protein [Sphaerisporangium aureirubrum]|uniref:SPW repeat protein n=1 Tax=Sphaerisporangium aureirubrum TaxID=1544736 RepID=A0ABW1NS40_9ACTN